MQNTDFGALFGQLKRLFTPTSGEKTDAAVQKTGDISASAPSPQVAPDKEQPAGGKLSGTGGAAPLSPAEPFTAKAEAFFMGHDKISRRIDERARTSAGDPPKTTVIAARPQAKAPAAPANEAKRVQTAAAEILTAARSQKPNAETMATARPQTAAESTAPAARQSVVEKTVQTAAAETVSAGDKSEHVRTQNQPAQAPKPAAPAPAKRTEPQTEKRAKNAPAYFALPLFPPSFPEESAAQDNAADPQSEE